MKTRIGKLSKKEGTSKAHHGVFDEEDEKQMKQRVKWEGRDRFHVIPMIYRYKLLHLVFTHDVTILSFARRTRV